MGEVVIKGAIETVRGWKFKRVLFWVGLALALDAFFVGLGGREVEAQQGIAIALVSLALLKASELCP
ncbi:MAG TPA: hypothetical protein VF719_04645 [Abditibacteriaceae bacterium]|jgi:hypothetical protein